LHQVGDLFELNVNSGAKRLNYELALSNV